VSPLRWCRSGSCCEAGNRLTATKTGASTQDYGYNNANQLCWSGTTSGSNGTTTCPATPAGDTAYTYDADGNQATGGGGGTAAYNNQNQTISNVVSGTTTTLAYAGAGQTERTAVGATTLINGLEGVAGQTNGTSLYFTRDPNGNLISLRQGAGGTSTNSYYLLDQQASVLGLTAADGTTDNASYTYDPYGVTLIATGTLATTNPYRYATSYYDAATGLYKLGARYYNPSVGRFTQPDPSGKETNTYAYTGDNPTTYIDPQGLDFLSLGVNVNFLGVFHAGVGVDIGDGGLRGFGDVGGGVSVGADDSPLSPIATVNSGSSRSGFSGSATACLGGGCVDQNGSPSLDLTGSTGLNADETYTS
jgi:RHS repeat-associated protein